MLPIWPGLQRSVTLISGITSDRTKTDTFSDTPTFFTGLKEGLFVNWEEDKGKSIRGKARKLEKHKMNKK